MGLLVATVAAPSIASDCVGTADYTVVFRATWSPATHPGAYPADAHFSGLVGATHGGDASFWELDALASQGIETMAERGGKDDLLVEVEEAIADGIAESAISGGGLSKSPGTRLVDLRVSAEQPLVTLVTMVAPSPDWFLGVRSLGMCADGRWLDKLEVELYPLDAGTDSGVTFTSPNHDTRPPQPISLIDTPPIGNGVPFGSFVFRNTRATLFEDGFESGDASAWTRATP